MFSSHRSLYFQVFGTTPTTLGGSCLRTTAPDRPAARHLITIRKTWLIHVLCPMLRLLILSTLFFLARWTPCRDTIPGVPGCLITTWSLPMTRSGSWMSACNRVTPPYLACPIAMPLPISAWKAAGSGSTSRVEHPRSVYLPDDFWGGDINYPETPFIHRIANVGFQPFRLIAIEHLPPGSPLAMQPRFRRNGNPGSQSVLHHP